jgi:hypothetical protein
VESGGDPICGPESVRARFLPGWAVVFFLDPAHNERDGLGCFGSSTSWRQLVGLFRVVIHHVDGATRGREDQKALSVGASVSHTTQFGHPCVPVCRHTVIAICKRDPSACLDLNCPLSLFH